jgi:hypothetical protein
MFGNHFQSILSSLRLSDSYSDPHFDNEKHSGEQNPMLSQFGSTSDSGSDFAADKSHWQIGHVTQSGSDRRGIADLSQFSASAIIFFW